MPLPLRLHPQTARILQADLAQALGLELLLGQRHAPVEHLRVAVNMTVLQIEPSNAVENHTRALRFGSLGVETEAVAGIADAARLDRIEELPPKVAAAI